MASREPLNEANPGIGKLQVLALGGDFELQAQESGCLITDEAQNPPGGIFEVTMPLATPGQHFYFSCTGISAAIRILPSDLSGDVFHFPDGLVESVNLGMDPTSQAHFSCDETGVWNFVSGAGKIFLNDLNDWFWANGPFENAPAYADGIISRREGVNTFDGSSNYPFVPGRDCETGPGARDVTLIGRYAKGVTHGVKAQASYHLNSGDGSVDIAGSSQIADIHQHAHTGNDTQTEMLAGDEANDGQYINVGPNRAVMVDIRVVAKCLSSPNDQQAVMWRMRFGALTDNAGAIASMGSAEIERVFETALGNEATWVAFPSVEASPSRIGIQVTGETGRNIGWTARVQLTEVFGRIVA